MKRIILIIFLVTFEIIIAQQFSSRIDKGIIESSEINEASGIAASIKNPGVFWTHNDSGDRSRIFAFDSSGNHLGTFLLAGVQNRDWEDICVGSDEQEEEQYIYIADIGDNSIRYKKKYIYRIIEPNISVGQTPVDTVIGEVDRLVFEYQDGKRNAETLMIDPTNLNIYIVSKEQNTKVYCIDYPYTFYSSPTFNTDTAMIIANLSFKLAVGGDISSDGKEILIKRKNIIYYWKKSEEETIEELLNKLPTTVPYIKEPQGEAVCWAEDLAGYYTISEGLHPHLYFYTRLVTNVEDQNIIPFNFKLEQNYPNPFNPITKIKYSIPNLAHSLIPSVERKEQSNRGVLENVTLKVYDIKGCEVTILVNKEQQSGSYEVNFDAGNLSSGLYFYRLVTTGFSQTKKMILLR